MKNNKIIKIKNGSCCATKNEILIWLKQQLIDNIQYEVDDEDTTLFGDKEWHELAIELINQLKEEDK